MMTPSRGPAARRNLFGLLIVALATMGTAACEDQLDVRGNVPDPKALAQLKPGISTRADVTQKLGAPSTVATFDKETWYYIGGRVKTVAFFAPEVLMRQVVTIRFDKSGRVAQIRKTDATKTKQIQLVDRVTPTKGKKLTILQQLIGNIGRFGSLPGADKEK